MAEESSVAPEVKLGKGQSLDYINLEKTDNNAIIVRWTVRTEQPTKSQSGWEDKNFAFSKEEVDKAIELVVKLLKLKAGIN